MATIYTHVGENVTKTWLLITAFIGLVLALGWALSYYLNAPVILYVAVLFNVVMTFVSYWYSDKIVVALAGAKPIAKQDDQELYRIVENLAITAGLPMPKIYIVNDPSPNAFATGRNPKNAVVAVTTGLRQVMDQKELEGVLAHELSHIGNRDMLLAAVAAVLAGFIITMVDMFMRLSFLGGLRRRDDRGGAGTIGLVVVLVASILGPLAAMLLRVAISRKREFLADASGVMLTRYPEGLASALQKIAAYPISMRQQPEAISHLWLTNPRKREQGRGNTPWFVSLWMTHPPIEARIKALREMAI